MKCNFLEILKDYCTNSTLAGLNYVTNNNLHVIERLFWLICIIVSGWGSYCLIMDYESNFESRAVSIVLESIHPFNKVNFPTIGVCDLYNKYDLGPEVEKYVAAMAPCGMDCYNYEVESHVAFILYPYFYHEGVIKGRCKALENCGDNCAKCPVNHYRDLLSRFSANCTDMFAECTLSGRTFECCDYFLPFLAPFGKCFLLNSLQNNQKGSPTWLNVSLDPVMDKPIMTIKGTRPFQVNIMNEEDVPHFALPMVNMEIMQPSQYKSFHFFLENIVNDPSVKEISPKYRQCRFPDELIDKTAFKAYSFSSCIADCVREHQMSACNCTAYSLLPNPSDKYPDCDLKGYTCLENTSLVKPYAKTLLPWSQSNQTCNCLPSCTEHDIRSIYESRSTKVKGTKLLHMDVIMSNWPTGQYRRQALRSRLDAVVSIGGILSLFLGASLLSGLELIYYFTVRCYNDRRRNP